MYLRNDIFLSSGIQWYKKQTWSLAFMELRNWLEESDFLKKLKYVMTNNKCYLQREWAMIQNKTEEKGQK